jgi:hypothetical protein
VSWAILAASAYVMNATRYSEGVVLGTRIVALLAILAVAIWFIVRPLLPKFGDDQVALYLEEHEHSLKASVITAVEMQRPGAGPTGAMRSPVLIDRLTRAAVDRVHKANDGRAIDAGELPNERRNSRRGVCRCCPADDVRPADASTGPAPDRYAVESRGGGQSVQHRRRSGKHDGRQGR